MGVCGCAGAYSLVSLSPCIFGAFLRRRVRVCDWWKAFRDTYGFRVARPSELQIDNSRSTILHLGGPSGVEFATFNVYAFFGGRV